MKSISDRLLKRYNLKGGVVIHLLAAIGGCLCLLGTSQNVSATNYFNWNVESNTTSVGNIIAYGQGTTRTTEAAHSGSWSMKLSVQGPGHDQPMGAELADYYRLPFNVVGSPALYYRWWMKIQPGFSWGNVEAKTKSGRVYGSTYNRVYTGYLHADGFSIEECEDVGSTQPGGGCGPIIVSDDTPAYIRYNMRAKNDGVWHEYIVMVKPNSTPTSYDAEFKAWVDGVFIGQQLNFRLHQYAGNGFMEAWGGWMVRPYFQLSGTSSDGGTIYVDDFSVDDTWNSLINVAPLSAPISLRVIP